MILQDRRISRRIHFAVCAFLCLFLCSQRAFASALATDAIAGWPPGPDPIHCETAVLMEADTGAILLDKGMNEVRYPASITKVMTAILVLESCQMTDVVTFTEDACQFAVEGNARIDAKPGEELTVEQCLYALLLSSANEVAAQLGITVSGSEAAFAEQMNAKAAQLGCTNTHFTNASGLPDDNHYTTAHDMALILRCAIQNPDFVRISGSLSYTIPPTNLTETPRELNTHNALLVPGDYHYDGAFAGKTGSTNAAGGTFVAAAARDGMTLISVSLKGASGEPVADAISLFDYGFANFTLHSAGEFYPDRVGSIVLPTGMDPSALAETTADDGSFQYLYQEHYLGYASAAPTQVPETSPAVTETPAPQATASDSPAPSPVVPQPEEDSYEGIFLALVGLNAAGVLLILAAVVYRKLSKKNRKRGKKRHT